jgi:hypothetical protein
MTHIERSRGSRLLPQAVQIVKAGDVITEELLSFGTHSDRELNRLSYFLIADDVPIVLVLDRVGYE